MAEQTDKEGKQFEDISELKKIENMTVRKSIT